MKKITFCLFLFSLCTLLMADSSHVHLQTTYLVNPVEGYHQLTITVDLKSGEGHLIKDPNLCSLTWFGDRDICTKMAVFPSKIKLIGLDVPDPTGQNRELFDVVNSGLKHELHLVVPHNKRGHYRFIYTVNGGERRVITLEEAGKLIPTPLLKRIDVAETKCKPLPRKVDDFEAQGAVFPGIVNDTYFALAAGKKLYKNTKVYLQPRIYTKKPNYWGMDVVECSESKFELGVRTYISEPLALDNFRGHKGIEIFWSDQSVKIEVPSK